MHFCEWKVLHFGNPALVQIMAYRRIGVKPLSEPMLTDSLMLICGTSGRWVKPLIECYEHTHMGVLYGQTDTQTGLDKCHQKPRRHRLPTIRIIRFITMTRTKIPVSMANYRTMKADRNKSPCVPDHHCYYLMIMIQYKNSPIMPGSHGLDGNVNIIIMIQYKDSPIMPGSHGLDGNVNIIIMI